jgi:hypothetical protein
LMMECRCTSSLPQACVHTFSSYWYTYLPCIRTERQLDKMMEGIDRSPKGEPSTKKKVRRSRSPVTREHKNEGGGRSSSRNRSPGYYAKREREGKYDGKRKEEYGEKEREKEREGDRARYEVATKEDVSGLVKIPLLKASSYCLDPS